MAVPMAAGQVFPFALNAKNKTGPVPRKTNAISAI